MPRGPSRPSSNGLVVAQGLLLAILKLRARRHGRSILCIGEALRDSTAGAPVRHQAAADDWQADSVGLSQVAAPHRWAQRGGHIMSGMIAVL